MNLRLDARAGDIVLTWPLKGRVSVEKAERFIEQHQDWIEKHRKKLPQAQNFAAGMPLSIAGRDCIIEQAQGRGLTRLEGGLLIVHGREEHLPRRVRDFLKREALTRLTELTREKTLSLGLKPAAVRVLDPKSRWGSCGPDGKIMYSWRLLLAPPEVMDYVVAHEVAHRVHLNHSRKFWALCASLAPHADKSRQWLRQNGARLMQYR